MKTVHTLPQTFRVSETIRKPPQAPLSPQPFAQAIKPQIPNF